MFSLPSKVNLIISQVVLFKKIDVTLIIEYIFLQDFRSPGYGVGSTRDTPFITFGHKASHDSVCREIVDCKHQNSSEIIKNKMNLHKLVTHPLSKFLLTRAT